MDTLSTPELSTPSGPSKETWAGNALPEAVGFEIRTMKYVEVSYLHTVDSGPMAASSCV